MEDLIIRAVAKSDTSLPTIEIGINKSGHAIFSLPPVGLPLPDQYSDSVEQGKQNRSLNSICTSQMSACLLLSLHQIGPLPTTTTYSSSCSSSSSPIANGEADAILL